MSAGLTGSATSRRTLCGHLGALLYNRDLASAIKRLPTKLLLPSAIRASSIFQDPILTSTTVNTRPRVLLVASTWTNLPEMPYVIRQAGFAVDILCRKTNISRHSGFLDRWIDAGETWQDLFEKLIELDRSGAYAHILLGEDAILWRIYTQPIPELDHLSPVREANARPMLAKIGFSQLCKGLGLRTPEFVILNSIEEADTVAEQLGFPLVTKINYSAAGEGVQVFQDREAYFAYLSTYRFGQPLLVQKFIDGELISVEALFRDGQLLQYVCSIDADATLGPSTKRRYVPRLQEVVEFLEPLAKFARLNCFTNITFVREFSSGQLFLIEVDPRPNKWAPYGHWFGADFSDAFRLFMGDGPIEHPPYLDRASENAVTHWEIEHFDSHVIKLIRAGSNSQSILHLLDFDTTLRYVLHDPALLREKTLRLRKRLKLPDED